MDDDASLVEDVLAFWFGRTEEGLRHRREWFHGDAAFDDRIRARFGVALDRALSGALDDLADAPRGALALVVLLDQFSRNLHRGSARAFAGDARALGVARRALDRRFDGELAPLERWFLYLPFEHSESLADQDRAVALVGALPSPPLPPGALRATLEHRAIIARFGRFPHRNAALGRASTDEERAFLADDDRSR